jgi:acyl-[acyl-carrier-protein]-phospholipid O-acyltransferase/long-chain-fatty-acid--[acyl-carrier-protein] ligase
MKWLVKLLIKWLYKVEVKGLENYEKAQASERPILIIANHVSLLDGLLIGLFIPGDTHFMVHKSHTQKWYERFLLSYVNYFPVDFFSPMATKHMIEALKAGHQSMIFPEGRITTTGSLMKIYEGTAMVADKTNAQVLPIFIKGAELSKFSYLDGTRFTYIKQRWFPKITLTVLPPTEIKAPEGVKGQQKHHFYKQKLYHIMRDSRFFGSYEPKSLLQVLEQARKTYDAKLDVIEDINGQTLSLNKLTLGVRVLGRALHKQLEGQARVGLMLPNVTGISATFFALQAFKHTPAMINFTAGLGPISSACETADLKTIITSHKFVEAFNLEPVIEGLADKVEFIYLEEVREGLGLTDKLYGLMTKLHCTPGYHTEPEDEAVVLFTSGSEGAPKGVVLTHANVTANIEQTTAMLTLLPGETIFNALPTFHSFGLTAGLLWPILKGARVFLYPSPLHYAVVPEMVYQVNAKVVFGTDTFFTGYARKADPYDFYSVRALVAGAERLRPETRQLYAEKFHAPIFEGYGVTETTPVLAVNTPLAYKHGSVGQFVPGIEYRLESVSGIEEGGRLHVKGPNIMRGYLMPDNPGVLVEPPEGWHDTGDIVYVDEDEFVWIKGRAKRFAKIGGEMVSLAAVEGYINKFSPEGHHVVVSVPDQRKGEQLVLVTDDDSLSRNTIKAAAKAAGVSEIYIPKTVILVEAVPVLGTGKTNYPEVQKIAERHFGEA